MRASIIAAGLLPLLAYGEPIPAPTPPTVTCTQPTASGTPGNVNIPLKVDCTQAISTIQLVKTYKPGSSFSFGTCDYTYTGSGSISGAKLYAAATAAIVKIIAACEFNQGSFSGNLGSGTINPPS